ncbi:MULTISPECIES: ribbon-helix-helix domain-containing protein [Ochrobactrum]|nr:type II toxin-antitoxin system ParD family antitoxin [Ochrobactrum sp. AN78]
MERFSSISLPSEQAAFIESKVRNGDYASVGEVVRAGSVH